MPEHDNIRAMWSEDELDQALAALAPPEDQDDHAFAKARAELMSSAGAPRPAQPPAPPRRRWGWWVAAAGTVIAVAASVLVAQTVRSEDSLPSAAAVERLNSSADRIQAGDQPVGPGQYRYVTTHAWSMAIVDRYSYLEEHLVEVWVPAEETEEWLLRHDVTGARKWLTGTEDEARAAGILLGTGPESKGEWRAPCGDWQASDDTSTACTTEATWQVPDKEFMASLPRDPDQLYDRLTEDTTGRGSDENRERLVYVADLLRTGLVPADLRAALYRTLAKVPDLEITEQVANLDGQKGTAYGISAAGTRHDVIIDPATGQFIGEREINEGAFANVPFGTAVQYSSVTTTVVAGMGVRP